MDLLSFKTHILLHLAIISPAEKHSNVQWLCVQIGWNPNPVSQNKLPALVSTQSNFCTPGCPLGVKAVLCSMGRCWHLLTLETIKPFTPQFPDAQCKTMPCDFYSQFMKPILSSQPFLLNACRIGAVFELGVVRASGGGYRKCTGCTETLSGKALLL